MENTADTAAASHTYNTPGVYTVKLTVTDDQVAPDTVTTTDNLTLTVFRLDVDGDNTHNSLVFSDDSASGTNGGSGSDGASGASGGSGTRSESGTATGSTTSTSSAQFTFTLKPVDATITTSVHVDIYSSNTAATRVKRIYDVTGPGRTFAASWDGTDSEGYRVPNDKYQVRGTVTYLASDGSSYSSVAAHTVTVSGGSISVKILNTDVRSNDPESANLYSDTTADVDTVGHGTSGSRSDSATIHYEITGGRVEDVARRRVRLHIYKVVMKNEVKTINLGTAVRTRLSAYWGGTDDSNQFSYGEHFAIITLDLDFNSDPEPEEEEEEEEEEKEWQQTYRSNSHAITVHSFPVAEAGNPQLINLAEIGVQAHLDGSKSHDPDDGNSDGAGIDTYTWRWGTRDWETATGVTADIHISDLGVNPVKLTVTDNDPQPLDYTDEVKVTAIELLGQRAMDGTSATFTITGATDATAFSWGWQLPSWLKSPVGNNPGVTFSSPNSNPTTVYKAHWYAYPNRPCDTDTESGARLECTYIITCDITFPDRTHRATASLDVYVPETLGQTPIVYRGKCARRQNPVTGLFEYTGLGTLTRGTSTLSESVLLPPTSQFYRSTAAHEQVHIDQYMSDTGIARHTHSPGNLHNYLSERSPSHPNPVVPPIYQLHARTETLLR